MKKPFLLSALSIACALAMPLAASAQFSLPKLGGSSGGTAAASDADPAASQDQLVRAYVAANRDVMVAQSKIAEAVGLNESAAQLNATASALGDGATKGALSDADKIQSQASRDIAERLKDSNLQMDAQAKKQYGAGMASLGSGLVRYVALRPQISQTANMVKANPLLAATKLGTAVYLVTNFPGNAKNVYDTLSMTTAFAKSHDIPVPADATKALSSF